ncbi:ABC transporter ATP-binding protein [Halomonas lysinitropha]|uniref:Hemin import ATP-binding protein HmuV n=1 Tax=Halomonas lysinitropha TaxID=2607506 RepID=A0A5K1I5Y6_9GAMM|nr:ABC transporter ATP-binding protein [Halomonas lysinitropha]VVZ95617.1 Hemin import ATP-binding protein HmuV [Halomonas lysinitropha]
MSRLEAQGLVIDIPDRDGGDPLDLTVLPGQMWGVLGPNGAGKTTLLHTLAGLRAPRCGRVEVDGVPLSRLRRRRLAQCLGLVFQEHHDGFPATVGETALIGRHPWLSPWQMETAEDLALAHRALARLDLAELGERLVATLSGGERQRLAIATLLAQDPGVWLADEPTNHLDLHHQVAVMRLLAEQAAGGRAVMMCLHDLNLAARWCDHLLLLYPDGEACWGPAPSMLLPEVLERLYGQRLASAEVEGSRVFVAVP